MRAVIFANGELNAPGQVLQWIKRDDLLIAADGGSRHCLALGLTPAVLIGDFDSMEPGDLDRFKSQGSRVIRHPARKDFTDLELALRFAREQGIEDIVVFGALGARWDQTLANLLLPAHTDLASSRIRLVDGNQEINLINSGQTLQVFGDPGDTVSLIPLNGAVAGVSTRGLEYPLDGESLAFGATRGVSNVLLEDRAEIFVQSGLLLCVVIRQNKAEPKT